MTRRRVLSLLLVVMMFFTMASKCGEKGEGPTDLDARREEIEQDATRRRLQRTQELDPTEPPTPGQGETQNFGPIDPNAPIDFEGGWDAYCNAYTGAANCQPMP